MNSFVQLLAFSLGPKLKRVMPQPGSLPLLLPHAIVAWQDTKGPASDRGTPYLPPRLHPKCHSP